MATQQRTKSTNASCDCAERLAAIERRLDLIESAPRIRFELGMHRAGVERDRRDAEAAERAARARADAAPERQQHFANWVGERLFVDTAATARMADLQQDYAEYVRALKLPAVERLDCDSEPSEFATALLSIGVSVGRLPVANGIPGSHVPAAIGAALLQPGETAAGRAAALETQAELDREERESRQAANRAAADRETERVNRMRDRDAGLAVLAKSRGE